MPAEAPALKEPRQAPGPVAPSCRAPQAWGASSSPTRSAGGSRRGIYKGPGERANTFCKCRLFSPWQFGSDGRTPGTRASRQETFWKCWNSVVAVQGALPRSPGRRADLGAARSDLVCLTWSGMRRTQMGQLGEGTETGRGSRFVGSQGRNGPWEGHGFCFTCMGLWNCET